MTQTRARTLLRWLPAGVAVGLISLSGCANPRLASLDYDPLTGGRPLPAAGTAARPPERATGDAIAAPPPDMGRSPAALTAAASVSLGTPRLTDAPSKPASETTGFTTAAGSETFEQLQQKLQTRGVTWQQLRGSERGEWVFSCGIPAPGQNNGHEKFYEAKAAGPNGLAAIRAVLAEIDADQK